MSGMEKQYNTCVPLNVDWADLDLFGHVNNVVFFRYFQTARVNYCESIGLTSLLDTSKPGFMVASSQCRFKKPLHYPGQIEVNVRVDWVKNSSFQIDYRIEKNGELIAEGEDVIVVYDHVAKCKLYIPATVREAITSIEQRIF